MPLPHEIGSLALRLDQELEVLRGQIEAQASLFPVQAAAASLTADTFDWGSGIIFPYRCGLVALSMFLVDGEAVVDVERDGVIEGDYSIDEEYVEFPKPLEFFPGSRLRFHTVSQVGTTTGVIAAWLRLM